MKIYLSCGIIEVCLGSSVNSFYYLQKSLELREIRHAPGYPGNNPEII